MKVRTFHLGDYVAVSQLFERVLEEECYEETIAAVARQLSWDTELVVVAEEQGMIVGAIVGTIDKNNHGYYYRIAIDASYRRRGIGKALVHALQTQFTHRKVSKILVSVDVHNQSILPLYESVGYHPLHDFSDATDKLSIVCG